MTPPRPRLLPPLLLGMALLAGVKLVGLWQGPTAPAPLARIVAPARAADPPVASAPAKPAAPAPPPEPPAEPTAEQRAERALLESLRARRTELEARDQAIAARETMLAAAERRLAARIETMATLQARLETAERRATEREEAGWRQMVKLYEGMRPRDAAVIFDELEMPVLTEIAGRMGERRAAAIMGVMKPERARALTAELARSRTRPAE